MIVDILLAALSIFLLIIGVLGCFLPVIPGPPLSFLGVLVLNYGNFTNFDTNTLFMMAGAAVVVTVLDYIVPVWGTKKFGGTKYGQWGATIGLIFGLFLGPFGIIFGPFVGALVGELIKGAEFNMALKSGFGSFLGFLTGVLLKLVVSITITVMCISEYFF